MPDARPLRPAPGRGPIFIIGAQGSGTTLLRLMLDSHERIAVPQETGFMRAYNAHQFIPFKLSGRNWAKRLGWSREELDQELAQLYDRLFMRYVERHGKQRWGEKTPFHTFHIDDMARIFPDSVFVGIVRHPAGSVASNLSRFEHSFNRATQHYFRYTKELARQATALPDRFVLLRYEDLVLQPERCMRELFAWLGEPWSDKVLAHHEVQRDRGGRLTVEGRNRADEPIDASRIDKWTRTLDAPTLRKVKRRLGRLGEFYGYSMSDPAVLEPLRDDGAPLIGGADIDARIDRFPALDLRTPVPVPNAERFYHPDRVRLAEVAEPEPARRPVLR
ncbi:MAG: sulfotransferase family protein, partial [Solirubrobacteraceae bacterium]